MKTLLLFISPLLFLPGFSTSVKNKAQEPVLSRLVFSFHTNDDDKDWDSQIDVQVIYDGHVIGESQCCNVNGADHYDNGSESPVLAIPIYEHLTRSQILNASYQVSLQANGNDKWAFDARLHADFDYGEPLDWTFLSHALNSRGSQWDSNTYPLSSCYR